MSKIVSARKREKQNKKNHNGEENKKINPMIIVAIIGMVGTIVIALIGAW